MDHTFVCTKKIVWIFAVAITVFATAEAQPTRGGLVSSPYTAVVNCPDAAS